MVFRNHFDKEKWAAMSERFKVARDRSAGPAGTCCICKEEVVGRRGKKNTVVLQHHLFNTCKIYPWSKAYPRD